MCPTDYTGLMAHSSEVHFEEDVYHRLNRDDTESPILHLKPSTGYTTPTFGTTASSHGTPASLVCSGSRLPCLVTRGPLHTTHSSALFGSLTATLLKAKNKGRTTLHAKSIAESKESFCRSSELHVSIGFCKPNPWSPLKSQRQLLL